MKYDFIIIIISISIHWKTENSYQDIMEIKNYISLKKYS